MNVFIAEIQTGIDRQLYGVYGTLEAARLDVAATVTENGMIEKRPNYWETPNGCDGLWIEEHKVM